MTVDVVHAKGETVPLTAATVLKIFIAPLIGAGLALMVMVGLVSSQTSAPSTNPASEPVLTYGD